MYRTTGTFKFDFLKKNWNNFFLNSSIFSFDPFSYPDPDGAKKTLARA
jgi:hypothetical protein